jgi:uncharacterized protein with PIN domain
VTYLELRVSPKSEIYISYHSCKNRHCPKCQKFRDELKKTDIFDDVDPKVWNQNWVVNCKPVGNGEHALRSLAPYLYRVALCNNRIIKIKDDKITFRFQESDTGKHHDKPDKLLCPHCGERLRLVEVISRKKKGHHNEADL